MSQLSGCIFFLLLNVTMVHQEASDLKMTEAIDEVTIKSILSEDQKSLHLQISLPISSNVGFELYDEEDSIVHLWHGQQLSLGDHQLKLNLPHLSGKRYMLHIQVGNEIFKQLLYIQ